MHCKKIADYFDKLDLEISSEKTKVMLLHKPNGNKIQDFTIMYKGQLLEHVVLFKYLGVWVDTHFNFRHHASIVDSKSSVAISFVHKFKRIIPQSILSLLVNSFSHSICDYCLPIWGVVPVANLNIIQNRVNNLVLTYEFPKFYALLRKSLFASGSGKVANNLKKLIQEKRRVNFDELLSKYNLLKLNERLYIFTLPRMFKIKKLSNNASLNTLFLASNRLDSSLLLVPTHATKFYESNFIYRATKLWNKLLPEYRLFTFIYSEFHCII